MSFQTATKKVSDIANAVTRQFGDESGVQVTTADIIRWVNQGQLDIARRQRLIKAKATANSIAGTGDYTFPADVLFVQQVTVNGLPVEYRSFEEASEYIKANDPTRFSTGQPSIWYEWAGTYSFWPIPDTSITGGIAVYYIQAPVVIDELTDNLTIPDTSFNTLLEYCMQQAHEMDEDWTAANVQGQKYEAAILQDGQDNNDVNQSTYQRITVLAEDM